MDNWGWVVVVVAIVVCGAISDMNTNKTPATQDTQTMDEQKPKHNLTPNDTFTDEDVKWLKYHGFEDFDGNGYWWTKELDCIDINIYKRADKFYVCFIVNDDASVETDRSGVTLMEAIQNANNVFRARAEIAMKASNTLDGFVQENCK